MIVYDPFWKTLREKGVTTYKLIHSYGISGGTIDQMKKGKGISTLKINDFCKILDCNVEDILQYVPSETDSKL